MDALQKETRVSKYFQAHYPNAFGTVAKRSMLMQARLSFEQPPTHREKIHHFAGPNESEAAGKGPIREQARSSSAYPPSQKRIKVQQKRPRYKSGRHTANCLLPQN